MPVWWKPIDRKVLEACGLSEKAQMRFQEFVENVQKNVIESGKRWKSVGIVSGMRFVRINRADGNETNEK